MKIYDHPLNDSVTVIEIEKLDEHNTFLKNIINGFDEYGNAYPSASCGDSDKKVIYLDGRRRSLFNLDETDILCDLTVRLADLNVGSEITSVIDESISLAEAAGDTKLLERLLMQPPEYFSGFKPVKKVA